RTASSVDAVDLAIGRGSHQPFSFVDGRVDGQLVTACHRRLDPHSTTAGQFARFALPKSAELLARRGGHLFARLCSWLAVRPQPAQLAATERAHFDGWGGGGHHHPVATAFAPTAASGPSTVEPLVWGVDFIWHHLADLVVYCAS